MTAPLDNIATALGLDTPEARDYVLRSYQELLDWRDEAIKVLTRAGHEAAALHHAHEEVLAKYRALRGHVRKDGRVKQAQPKDVALAAAERMTQKHGKEFTAYPCPLCHGQWHVGHLRGDDNDNMEDTMSKTITIEGASDDLVYLTPEIDGLDEIGCFDNDVHLLVRAGDDAGVRVVMRYGKRGPVWSAEISPVDEGVPMPPISVALGGRGYTPAVTIEGVTSVEHVNAEVEA